MFFKRVIIRNLYFCNGSNPCTSEDTYGKNYQVAEKEEDDLNEQEEDIFDDEEDDTITVSGKDCQKSLS